MTREELKQRLSKIGIDIEKDRYVLDIDYGFTSCGNLYCKNESGYVHIYKGDRDNGRVVETFDSEDDFVEAVIRHIYHMTLLKREKYHSKREDIKKILEDAKIRKDVKI